MKEYEVNLLFLNAGEDLNPLLDYFIQIIENNDGFFSGNGGYSVETGNIVISGIVEIENFSTPDLNNKIILSFAEIGIAVASSVTEYSGE